MTVSRSLAPGPRTLLPILVTLSQSSDMLMVVVVRAEVCGDYNDDDVRRDLAFGGVVIWNDNPSREVEKFEG